MTWDVKDQVKYAITYTGKVAHFIIRDSSENSSNQYLSSFYSREYSSEYRPTLEVTYVP